MSSLNDFNILVIAETADGQVRPVTQDELENFSKDLRAASDNLGWTIRADHEGVIHGTLYDRKWHDCEQDVCFLSAKYPEFFIQLTVKPECGAPWRVYVKDADGDGGSQLSGGSTVFEPCRLTATSQKGEVDISSIEAWHVARAACTEGVAIGVLYDAGEIEGYDMIEGYDAEKHRPLLVEWIRRNSDVLEGAMSDVMWSNVPTLEDLEKIASGGASE